MIEKQASGEVGSRLDVFHIDTELFDEFGLTMTREGDDDFLMVMEKV